MLNYRQETALVVKDEDCKIFNLSIMYGENNENQYENAFSGKKLLFYLF